MTARMVYYEKWDELQVVFRFYWETAVHPKSGLETCGMGWELVPSTGREDV